MIIVNRRPNLKGMINRVLIISHLCINDTNNVGKTLWSLFYKFHPDELMNLFFNPILPNNNKCHTWFKITDNDILKSYFLKKAGNECSSGDTDNEYRKISSFIKQVNKTSLKLILRDLIWKFGRISDYRLTKWIDNNKPKVIFFAAGYSCFAYRIALKISNKFSIPLYTFLMDDYYHEVKNKSLIERVRKKWLKRYIYKTIKESSKVFACSEEMAKAYQLEFDKPISVLYTPYIDNNNAQEKANNQQSRQCISEPVKSLKFIYAGSLGLKRWEILLKIGKYLKTNYPTSTLEVYASSAYKNEIDHLKKCKNIFYKGFVNSKELSQRISESDVVLHVESFNEEVYIRTRYSISTKIPECLASGKMFLAIGPRGQAGLEYLKRNNAAVVCNDENELGNSIDLVHKTKEYSIFINNAQFLLKTNHNPEMSYKLLHN